MSSRSSGGEVRFLPAASGAGARAPVNSADEWLLRRFRPGARRQVGRLESLAPRPWWHWRGSPHHWR